MQKEIIFTNDGSNSIYNNDINESYHSKHGAIVEAEHVFIRNGLIGCLKNNLKILEIGFGTGLNTLLTAIKAKQKKWKIHYHTIEKYPIEDSYYKNLNFTQLIGCEKDSLIQIHEAKWEKEIQINPYFKLTKNMIDIKEYESNIKFDIIFFDAFSPEKQPEMWTEKVFLKMNGLLQHPGSLVTYCAKGSVKRKLKSAGFEVISLDGPPGKRQMIKANKKLIL